MINIVITPSILTDDIFVEYGGQTGTSTPAQRQAAYAMAESGAAEEIGTFVSPTIVTGTYTWPPVNQPFDLEHTHLRRVLGVTAIHDAGCDCADDALEISGCAWIKSPDAGIVQVKECGDLLKASCNCFRGRGGWGYGVPYQVRIAYEAGLPTGAAFSPNLLMGLTMAASIFLGQITDPESGAGGPGEPGVKSFRSLSYSETRSELGQRVTAFGASPRANYAAQLLSVFKYKGAMKLGF